MRGNMAAIAPALSGVNHTSSNQSTVNYISLNVSSGSAAIDQARDIKRELDRMGLRFSG